MIVGEVIEFRAPRYKLGGQALELRDFSIEATNISLHVLNEFRDLEDPKVRRNRIADEKLGTWTVWKFPIQCLGPNTCRANRTVVVPVYESKCIVA